MRPDIEDFDELPGQDGGSRRLSWLVLAGALGSFVLLAYIAFHNGSADSEGSGDLMVVEAEKSPAKERPADADGEQFANQDKTIYDVIAAAPQDHGAERLLPESEAPAEAAPAAAAAESPAVAPVAASAKTGDAAGSSSYVSESLQPAPAAASAPAATTAASPAPVAASTPAPAPTSQNADHSGPKLINESPAVPAKPAATAAKPAAKKPAAAAHVPASAGAYQIQLGAFKSEAEANAAWKKLAAKHGATLGSAPTIQRADLPAGTFYRLRAGSYGSIADAKAACATLGSAACFPAKAK